MLKISMVCVVLAGCATPYQRMGIRGGYEEREVGNGTVLVNVRVNGFTSRGKAIEYAFRRANEICPSGYEMTGATEGGSTMIIMRPDMIQQVNKPEITVFVRCRIHTVTE